MLLLKFRSTQKSETGFSLIEIMVSVLIIGILAAIAVPIFAEQQKVALRQEVKQDVLNTASNIAQWQLTQPGEETSAAYPNDAQFTKLTVKTNASTTVSRSQSPDYTQVCVTGTRVIGGATYTVSYNLREKTIRESACNFSATVSEDTGENYG